MLQSTRTSKTAKSFGFVILASIRKLPLPLCLIILIVMLVIWKASWHRAVWTGRLAQTAAIRALLCIASSNDYLSRCLRLHPLLSHERHLLSPDRAISRRRRSSSGDQEGLRQRPPVLESRIGS